MFDVAVHTAIGQQTEQMQRAAGLLNVIDRPVQFLVLEELAASHQTGNPHQFLVDDPARAKILVADFAVPHHTRRQSDILARRVNLDIGVLSQQPVIDGRSREMNRVKGIHFRVGVVAPSIPHDQYHRPPRRHIRHQY